MKPPVNTDLYDEKTKTLTIRNVRHVAVVEKGGQVTYYGFKSDGTVKILCAKLDKFAVAHTGDYKKKAKYKTKSKAKLLADKVCPSCNCFKVGGVD